MANYFDSCASYEKIQEDGTNKKVVEHILVDAESFTEAEAKTIEYFGSSNTNELFVKSIKREPVSEIMNADGDKWYRCKVAFITLDEKTGKDKKTFSNIIVQAKNITEAKKVFEDGMKGTMSDWELNTVQETSFIDLVL